MPPLERPKSMALTKLPPREVPVFAETDVLIIGGGPAGLGAALGAAEAGANVLLAERYGFLGGSATAALVITFMSSHTQQPTEDIGIADQLFPNDHGAGRPVVGGVLERLLDRLVAHGGAMAPSLQTGYVCPFDAEAFKTVALQMLDEAGVDYLLHALATDILGDEEIEGVVFETKSGPGVIKARLVIDCTGDGDVAAKAGALFEVGRDTDGLVQPMTLMFRLSGFLGTRFKEYVKQNPNDWCGVNGLWKLIEVASTKGDLEMPRDDILLFGTSHEQDLSINSTRISHVLGTDVWDLTFAECQGRHQMEHLASFLRQYVPGFERTYISQSATTVGVRETRRIVGDYRITARDILEARKFDDVIARGTYPLDIHDPEGKGTLLRRLPPGEAYDIPLRSLFPKGLRNLLVAGRCISGTHEAHSSYRIMPLCLATGQAAGVCAALAIRNGMYPREIPVAQVQQELIRQKASLRD